MGIKIALGLIVLVVGVVMFLLFYRPLSLKLRGINSVGLTIKKDGVYVDGEKMADADPATFRDLGMAYSKDKNHVFFFKEILVGVSPTQFRKISGDPEDYSFRDETRVFLGGQVMPEADPATFSKIGDGIFRDKSYLFWNRQARKQIDVASFKFLGLGYGKDKSNVYQFGSQGGAFDELVKIVEGADVASFEVLPNASGLTSVPTPEQYRTPDSKDQNNRYRNGKVLPK